MAKIKQQVTITAKELKEIVCKLYNLELQNATVNVKHLPANQREPEYVEIIIESTKYEKANDPF